MKKKNKDWRWILAVGAGAFLAALVILLLSSPGAKGAADGLSPVTLIGWYSLDGSEQAAFDGQNPPEMDGRHHTLTITGRFSQPIGSDGVLYLLTSHMRVKLKLNGETFYGYEKGKDHPVMFRSAGSVWAGVKLPEMRPGDTVELTLYNYHISGNNCSFATFFDNLSTGGVDALWNELRRNSLLPILVGLFIISVGITAMIVAVITRFQRMPVTANIALFGLFAAVGGTYVLFDGLFPYFSLLIPDPFLSEVVDVVVLMLLPATPIMMMAQYMEDDTRQKQVLYVSMAVILAIDLTLLVLQILGMLDLYESSNSLIPTFMLVSTVSAAAVSVELVRRRNQQLAIMLITFSPVLLSVFIEVINTFLPMFPPRMIVPASIMITVLLQIVRLVRSAREASRRLVESERIKSELRESRYLTMLSQIQPHFLCNALYAIQDLCHDKAPQAELATVQFSEFLRGSVDALSSVSTIPFSQELKHTENYLALEKLRFGERLQVEYDIGETDFEIPTLTLQPIVENAVCRGILKKVEGGTVRISVKREDGSICITVLDDGIGFDVEMLSANGRNHIGINNVRDRLREICGGTLSITSTPGHGTEAVIILPEVCNNDSSRA